MTARTASQSGLPPVFAALMLAATLTHIAGFICSSSIASADSFAANASLIAANETAWRLSVGLYLLSALLGLALAALSPLALGGPGWAAGAAAVAGAFRAAESLLTSGGMSLRLAAIDNQITAPALPPVSAADVHALLRDIANTFFGTGALFLGISLFLTFWLLGQKRAIPWWLAVIGALAGCTVTGGEAATLILPDLALPSSTVQGPSLLAQIAASLWMLAMAARRRLAAP